MDDSSNASQQARVTSLGGIDLRSGKHNLKPGRWERLHGMYPAQNGLNRRFPGKLPLRKIGGNEIRGGIQTFDGSGNVLVQGISSGQGVLYSVTLDELLSRAAAAASITPTPSPLEEDMSYALFIHTVAAGSSGGDLDAAGTDGTYYKSDITNEVQDEDAFATLASNEITLPVGVYRISALRAFGTNTTFDRVRARAGLYNVTDAGFEVHKGTATEIFGTSSVLGEPGANECNGWIAIEGRFEVVGGPKAFAIYMSGVPASSTNWVRNAIAQGTTTTGVGGKAEIYAIIKILQE